MFEDFYDRISEGMAEADSWFHEGLGWNMAPIIFMDNRTLLCKWYCDIDFTPQGFCTELFKCCTNYEEQKSIKPNKICISQKDLKEFGIFIPITVEKIFISICEPEDEEEPCSFDIGNNARLEKEVFNLELEFDSIGSDWPIQLLNTELPRDEKDEELYEDDDKDSDFD